MEEFILFFMQQLKGDIEITYFFYRSLFASFSFRFDNLIKVLYSVHRMQPPDDEEGDADAQGEAKEEGGQDDGRPEDYGEETDEDQYGEYDDELDYGNEQNDEEEEEDEASNSK